MHTVGSHIQDSPSQSWPIRHPLLILGLLFLVSITVRILTAEYVDIGGDNTTRWVDAIRLAEGYGFVDWSHHNMRWAIVIPLFAFIKAFGHHPVLYYALPILFSSIGAVFIYLIGRRLHSTELGIYAALLTILFPQMAQTGSQLWPSVYQFTFIAIACWAILIFDEKRKTTLLFAAALLFSLAWGARLSAVYYFPGLLFIIWWPRKDFKAVLLFCLFVGFFLLAEWAFFWIESGNPLGRVGLIKIAAVRDIGAISLKKYLLHPLKLAKLRGLLPIFIVSIIASIALLRSSDRRLAAFSVFHLTFLFFYLYMVSGFSPIRLAQPIGSRYWCAIAPFGLTIILIWLFNLKISFPKTTKSLIAILFIAFIVFSAKKIPARNALIQTFHDNIVLQQVMAQRQPFLLHWSPWTPNWIEAQLFHAIGIKHKKQRRPDHTNTAMIRGSHRAVGLYSQNPENYYMNSKATLEPLSGLSYKFIPYGTSPDTPVGATIFFDRRTAYSVAGEQWPTTTKNE